MDRACKPAGPSKLGDGQEAIALDEEQAKDGSRREGKHLAASHGRLPFYGPGYRTFICPLVCPSAMNSDYVSFSDSYIAVLGPTCVARSDSFSQHIPPEPSHKREGTQKGSLAT